MNDAEQDVTYSRASSRSASEDEERARQGDPDAIAHLLRRSSGTIQEKLGSYEDRARQAERYFELALRLGKILPEGFLDGMTAITGNGLDGKPVGGEHQVYKRGSRAFKITHNHESFDYGTGTGLDYQTTPHLYLERFAISNALFDSRIVWEGIIAVEGHIRTVTSQHFYRGEHPKTVEIHDFLYEVGFVYNELPSPIPGMQPDRIWYSATDEMILGDAKPENFIKTMDNIFPIDFILEITTSDHWATYAPNPE